LDDEGLLVEYSIQDSTLQGRQKVTMNEEIQSLLIYDNYLIIGDIMGGLSLWDTQGLKNLKFKIQMPLGIINMIIRRNFIFILHQNGLNVFDMDEIEGSNRILTNYKITSKNIAICSDGHQYIACKDNNTL